MQTPLLINILTGLLALTALLAIIFGVSRGRKVGAGLAFGMGGFFLLVFSAGFGFTFLLATKMNMAGLAGVAQKMGDAPKEAALLAKTVPLSVPVSVLEPIAVLLLALGMSALARNTASLAPAGAAPAVDDAEDQGGDDEFAFDDEEERF